MQPSMHGSLALDKELHHTPYWSELASRRASSRLASTSQPSRTVTRSYYGSSQFSFSDDDRRSEAKVLSIPWMESKGKGWSEFENPEGWGPRRDDWGPEREETAAETAAARQDGAGAQLTAQSQKPLKINRDLLLWRARQLRQDSFRMPNFTAKMQQLASAEAALRRCIELDPTDARAYVALGKQLQLERRFEEAGKVYDDAIAVTGGRNAFIWQSWATLEAKMGHSAQARKYYKAAVLVDPKHAAAWHGWGMLERSEGDLVAARDTWIKGVKKTEGFPNPHLYNSLGVLAGEMGFVEEARAWFKQGTSSVRGAGSTALWHSWASLEERSGEPRVVRYLYKKGLQASPMSRYIHLSWALFERAEGQVKNARELLQRGNMYNPKDAAILQAWAILEEEEGGNSDEARRLFKRATEADPRMTHAWQAWGMLELRQGDYAQARRLFQSAVWSAPANRDACIVWQAWATLEYRASNIGLARSMYNCAVKADPSSTKAWQSWIRMEEELGEEGRAAKLARLQGSGEGGFQVPPRFLTPAEVPDASEPSILESVMDTVSDWINKFEKKRSVAQRRPPSYKTPPREDALLEQQPEELPDIEGMMEHDSTKLDLPAVASNIRRPKRRRSAKSQQPALR